MDVRRKDLQSNVFARQTHMENDAKKVNAEDTWGVELILSSTMKS